MQKLTISFIASNANLTTVTLSLSKVLNHTRCPDHTQRWSEIFGLPSVHHGWIGILNPASSHTAKANIMVTFEWIAQGIMQ